MRTALRLIAMMVGFTFTACPVSARPVVVFESGLGDGAQAWDGIVGSLPAATRIFRYDRPGYGTAPTTRTARDPCTIARELRAKLKAGNVPPPYILVGHSLGGQYQYAFSKLYPGDVAGLLLLDATPPGHFSTIRRQLPVLAAQLLHIRKVAFSRTMQREFDAQDKCLATLPAEPPAFSVRMLVAGNRDPDGGIPLQNIDRTLARQWSANTGAAKLEIVSGSGHYIQNDKPAVVVKVLNALIARVPK